MTHEREARNALLPDSLKSPPQHHVLPRATLPPGFRNMFVGPDEPEEAVVNRRYRGLGTTEKTLPLLQAISVRMMNDGFGENKDRHIPAGYTYLFQLVSHDLQFTAREDLARPSPYPDLGSEGWLHRRRLMLETAYGLESQDPSPLFETNSKGSILFRLDSERAFEQGGPDWRRNLPRKPLAAADTRNDENPLVAQSTALFLLLHNLATRNLEDHGYAQEEKFIAARLVTRFIYRQIILTDFLSKLIRDDIHKLYVQDGARWDRLQFPDDTRRSKELADNFPIEVSHVAIRTGHALVRRGYLFDSSASVPKLRTIGITDLLGMTSSRRAPGTSFWMAPWPLLFGGDGNLAQPFCPHMNRELSEADPLRIDAASNFQADLILRDLARGMNGGQLQVDAIADQTQALLLEMFGAERWLSTDQQARRDAVQAWADNAGGVSLESTLAEIDPGSGDAERNQAIHSLVSDPPLLFFLLLEAAAPLDDGGGAKKHLGAMGSIILVECLFGALQLTRAYVEDHPELKKWCKLAIGEDVPSTMEKLIELLRTQE